MALTSLRQNLDQSVRAAARWQFNSDSEGIRLTTATLPSAVPYDPWCWQFAEHYEILRLLAHGGQGTIYAAKDCRTDRLVALKLIESDDAERSQAHQRLMLEAEIGSRLTCEHVATVFDAGRDSATGLSYLTMELLEGTDLQRHVEQSGPIAPATAVEYLRQAAVGLDLAHRWRDSQHRLTPIVHRDLKPGNLFLSKREDGTTLVKILDFGIAKVLAPSAPASGNMRGSPLYMAPEQVLGAQLSPATDIWAIGLSAFFLLTGKPYWVQGQDQRCVIPALLREVTTGATVPPSRRLKQLNLLGELPEAFDGWFLHCVHRDPKQRFKSAGIAVIALAAALNVALVARRRRFDSGIRLKLTEPEAPNPSGRVVQRWQALCFWLGAAGGFCAVLGIADPFLSAPSVVTRKCRVVGEERSQPSVLHGTTHSEVIETLPVR